MGRETSETRFVDCLHCTTGAFVCNSVSSFDSSQFGVNLRVKTYTTMSGLQATQENSDRKETITARDQSETSPLVAKCN